MSNLTLRPITDGTKKEYDFLVASLADKEHKETFDSNNYCSHSPYFSKLGIFNEEVLVGGVHLYSHDELSYDIDYFVGKHFRKNGYASSAIKKCIDLVAGFGGAAVEANVFQTNTGSKKALAKNGFNLSEHPIYSYMVRARYDID